MATMKLAETQMGKFRLTSMRNRMAAFTAANPEAFLNVDDFFEAVNADVASPMNQDEVNAHLAIAAELSQRGRGALDGRGFIAGLEASGVAVRPTSSRGAGGSGRGRAAGPPLAWRGSVGALRGRRRAGRGWRGSRAIFSVHLHISPGNISADLLV